MKKDISYYTSLPYKIQIEPIPKEEGGGYVASIPQFGMSIVGDGETIEEAISNLEHTKRVRFLSYLDSGKEIPEPTEDEEFSGKLLLRIPKYLHRELALFAKKNESSLNQTLASLLSSSIASEKFSRRIDEFEKNIISMSTSLCELKVGLESNFVKIPVVSPSRYYFEEYNQAA